MLIPPQEEKFRNLIKKPTLTRRSGSDQRRERWATEGTEARGLRHVPVFPGSDLGTPAHRDRCLQRSLRKRKTPVSLRIKDGAAG